SPDGRVTHHEYDVNGNVIGETPPGRTTHSFSYSPVDLVSEYSPPAVVSGENSTHFNFNADRELTLITRPDGLTTFFDRISGGCSCERLNFLVQPRGTSSFTYDPQTGNLSMLTSPDGVNLTFAYAGSLLTNETWAGPVPGNVNSTLDNDLFTASRRVNAGSAVVFLYDADKLLTQAGSLAITRDAQNGLITRTILGSITNNWAYNEFAEPTNHSAVYGATPLYSVQYIRDAGARIATKIETIGGVTSQYAYTYDLAGRLAVVTLNGVTNAVYSYDTKDDRLSITTDSETRIASYDQQDRLVSYGADTFTYNANGELATKTITGQTTTYEYDVLGNLIHVVLPNGTDIRYVIDGLDLRIGKKINGVLTQGFLYDDADRLVAELDGAGNVVSEFVYGTFDDAPDYLIKAGETYRIVADHLGSPRIVANVASGQIAQRIDYDAFGRVLADTAPGFQPFGLAGGLYDPDNRLVRFGTRDYDAETGRWTAKDPILFAGDQANLYAYVGNDPINNSDPDGLQRKGVGGKGGKGGNGGEGG